MKVKDSTDVRQPLKRWTVSRSRPIGVPILIEMPDCATGLEILKEAARQKGKAA